MDSTWLDNNVVIAIQTNWLSIVLGLVFIVALHFLARKRVGFGTRVLIALGLGLVAGIVLNVAEANYDAIQLVGSIYVNLIRMVVIPLVFVLVINSIISITDTGYLKKIGGKTIGWFLLTTGIAAVIGLLTALALNLAQVSTPKRRKTSRRGKFLRCSRSFSTRCRTTRSATRQTSKWCPFSSSLCLLPSPR